MWHTFCSDQHQKSRQVGAVGVGWMASATSHAACKGARAEAAWQAACAVKCLHPGCCRSAADKTAALAGRLCSASAAVLAAAGQQLHSQAALHKATTSSERVTQSRRKRPQVAGKQVAGKRGAARASRRRPAACSEPSSVAGQCASPAWVRAPDPSAHSTAQHSTAALHAAWPPSSPNCRPSRLTCLGAGSSQAGSRPSLL